MLRVSQHSASSSPDWLGPAATAASPLASRWAAPAKIQSRQRITFGAISAIITLSPSSLAALALALTLVVEHGPPRRLLENAYHLGCGRFVLHLLLLPSFIWVCSPYISSGIYIVASRRRPNPPRRSGPAA